VALFVKVLTKVPRQEKFVQAGPVACWLWVAGLCYSRDGSTDGFIPKMIVPTLVPELKGAFKHAAKLVEVRLWEDAIGGYLIHDYLDENPSRAEIETMKSKDRDRKRDGVPDGIQMESKRSLRAGASSPSVSASEPFGRGAGETASPLIDGKELRRHGQHAKCYPERGLCVTPWVWDELLGKLGGDPDDKRARLLAWMDGEVAALSPRESIGATPDKWWRRRYEAWVGQSEYRPSGVPDVAATLAYIHGGKA
jgi:hypothetical protein